MSERAVVTGAGSGIGRAVALRLAAEGYRLVLLGRRAEALGTTMGRLVGSDHLALPTDLTDPGMVTATAKAIARDGPVEALIHVAGGAVSTEGEGLEALAERVMATYQQNLSSAALLTEALIPTLTDGRGRVVATSSVAAFTSVGGPAYGPAKAALHPWAFAMAERLGPRGITVNVIAPGYIADTEFFGESMTEERHKMLIDKTMVGRAGTPEDVAALAAFLVSADSGYITAQVISANGGSLAR